MSTSLLHLVTLASPDSVITTLHFYSFVLPSLSLCVSLCAFSAFCGTLFLCLSKFTTIVWKFTLLVWWQLCAFFSCLFFFFLLFFLVCCSTSEIQRGAFCVWLCPKGSRLARQINNYRVHNIGENNFSIFDVKHERNQNYKEKKDDEERSWKMVFLSVSLSWQYFLLLLLSTVSQCIKNITEDLKERGVCPWRATFEKWHGNYSLWQCHWRWERVIYIMFHRIWSICLHVWAHQ